MNKVDRIKLYKKAHSKFGPVTQMLMCVEECSELQKALLHHLRDIKISDVEHILDELVDVYIMVEQMQEMFGISNEKFLRKRNLKLERLIELVQ